MHCTFLSQRKVSFLEEGEQLFYSQNELLLKNDISSFYSLYEGNSGHKLSYFMESNNQFFRIWFITSNGSRENGNVIGKSKKNHKISA